MHYKAGGQPPIAGEGGYRMSGEPETRICIRKVETLADSWYVLRKYTFDYRRRDGTWQCLCREACHRGDSAVILLYCRSRGTVVLTRQFRLPVFVSGCADGMSIEAPAGLLDGDSPGDAIRREAEEETGIRIEKAEEVLTAFMSPALITERVHFYVAGFTPGDWKSPGGGCPAESEDIEVFEVGLDEALAMVESGRIADGKTVLLLLYAKANGLFEDGFRAGSARHQDSTVLKEYGSHGHFTDAR
jgi:nudix-type nucleoside diphosphatase (YffH/AdpP family)